ncbi:hypothetical protein CASFOL_024431 [Castilleja foliolosa]|uniref:Uncharacterized protein n=1 Tax=Castilleja foliolosa TaxID=1961234 RepID=A0ABD3CPP6_9LAMI
MSEVPPLESKHEDQETDAPTEISRKPFRKQLRQFEDLGPTSKARKSEGAFLAASKPSYCLKRGIGDLQCGSESHRHQHRERLWRLLNNLIQRHNWAEASGVMSVLLQGTVSDSSIFRNRAKYSAALELLCNIKGETTSSRRIQGVYELWMKKLGPLKNWSTKERFALQLEFILICIQHGSMEDAYQSALCVMQQTDFDSDPVANLVVGLTFYQLWYSNIPKELQLTNLDPSVTFLQPEVHDDGTQMSIDFSVDNDAHEAGVSIGLSCDSNTSIAIDKEVEDSGSQQKKPMDVDENVKTEPSHSGSQALVPHVESVEASGNSNYSNYSDDLPRGSIFYSRGLPPWLLPINLPSSDENLEDAIRMHRKLLNSHYKNGLKYLRAALYSTPPVVEAVHPFIQMLLLGDQVQEAIDEVETLSDTLDTVLLLRMKASLTEHFDRGNYIRMCICFEGILKKDPTCSDSLARLTLMHRRGEYDTLSLVEMIALHLEATYGTCDAWRELASCLLRISQCEEDRISTYGDSSDRRQGQVHLENPSKVPELFTDGESGSTWRIRAKWWLSRHFNNRMLMSDIASGDLKLVTYKAAAASHIYGRHFSYVVKAIECIEKENDMELCSFLQKHTLNTVGFYSATRSI